MKGLRWKWAGIMLFLAFAAVILPAVGASAETLTFTADAESMFTSAGGTVTGYLGDKNTVTRIMVPPMLGGQAVTEIGASAFADCPLLESVIIPDTVTALSSQAFARDVKLAEMTAYAPAELNGGVLSREGNTWDAKVAELPGNLAVLAPDAFLTCNSIRTFRVKDSNPVFAAYSESQQDSQASEGDSQQENGQPAPEGSAQPAAVKDYHEGEFLLSKDARTVLRYAPGNHVNGQIHIPSGITMIGSYAFESGDSTGGVVIPNTVTAIGDYGFYGFRGILTVQFEEPSQLATIGAYAFSHLGILNIKLPASVSTIGDYCFAEISNAQQLDISGTKITVIPAYAFANNPDLHELTMPGTVTEIKGYAFSGSGNLDTVKFLGGTLTKLEAHAFENCRTLHEITIPEGVTAIEDSTFSGCSNLGTVILPSTLQTIGENAFKDCVTIHEMVIPEGVTYVAQNSFEGARTDLIDTSKSEAARLVIAGGLLKEGSIIVVNGLRYRLLADADQGQGRVCVIGATKKKLKKLTIPASVEYTVGASTAAFQVTAIGNKAFAGYKKLKRAVIGKNVQSIGKQAFYGDKKLKKVKVLTKKLRKVGKQAFKKTAKRIRFQLPKSKKKKYRKLLKH